MVHAPRYPRPGAPAGAFTSSSCHYWHWAAPRVGKWIPEAEQSLQRNRPQVFAIGSHWGHMEVTITMGHGPCLQHLPSGSFLMKKTILESGHPGGIHGSPIWKHSSDCRQEGGRGQKWAMAPWQWRQLAGRQCTEGARWKLEGVEARHCRDLSLYMLLRELQTKNVLSALVLELSDCHCTFY